MPFGLPAELPSEQATDASFDLGDEAHGSRAGPA